MAESSAEKGDKANAKQFAIQRIYVKDVSFESPSAPDIFRLNDFKPEVGVQLNTEIKKLAESVYTVTLSVTVTTEQEEKTVYLAEVHQAGIFTVQNFSEEEQDHLLNVYCPNTLFPYAREVVAELVAKGGFPQLILAPVNFDAHYQQGLAQKQQTDEAELHH